jgi:epoxyqueuosine reductase
MDRVLLTAAVKQEAARLGFELVGVTTPDPPPHFDNFQRWLAEGRHGTMDYLASERARSRRADPRAILPGCRSILVVGMRHSLPAAGPRPRVAAYAVGADYHEVILRRLEQLMGFLRPLARPSFAYRLYTDTGPILERDLAQRAGLGWIGKNTCLIHPRHGSYFLLGEALLSEELEPDDPIAVDHCGSCTRCLEACPTDCILPDRTLDAPRCISYQTIENRGAVPIELRAPIGDWLFGCDICQQVCPWNIRFARPSADPEVEPSPHLASPDLGALLESRISLQSSATSRARRRGMARNAAVVLGNRREAEAVGPLRQALLAHAEPLVRRHAAWALGEIGGETAEAALRLSARSERDEDVQGEIAQALARIVPWSIPPPPSLAPDV